jgi:hypothetical protein
MALPDPTEEPTITVERVAELYGIGRRLVYALCNKCLDSNGAEGIPCLRFGHALRVPIASAIPPLSGQTEASA